MRKTLLLTIMIVCCATFSFAQGLTNLWTVNPAWAVGTGGTHRDATVSDGRIYVANNAAATIRVIDGATGADLPSITGVTNIGFGIAADNAGNLLVPNNTGGGMNWNLRRVNIGTEVVATIPSWTNPTTRADRLSVRGDINGSAFIFAHGNGILQAWEVQGGVQTAFFTAPSTETGTTLGQKVTWIDDSRGLLTAQNQIPRIITVDFSANPFITARQNVGTALTASSGGAFFELGGIPYIVIPGVATSGAGSGRHGSVKMFDVTNPASPVQIGTHTPNIGGGGDGGIPNTGIHAEVANYRAVVYVWAPGNGAAAHEISSVATPTLSHVAGTHIADNITVTVTNNPSSAALRYLIGDAIPTATNTAPWPAGGLDLGEGTHRVRVLATADGLLPNRAIDVTYVVEAPAPQGRTFEVEVPCRTERVYLVGSFTNWSLEDAIPMTRVGTTDVFTVTVQGLEAGGEYFYMSARDWYCKEGRLHNNNVYNDVPNRQLPAGDSDVNDVVEAWVNVPSLHFNVSFRSGVEVPADLWVRVIGPAGGNWTAVDVPLTRDGNTFSGTHGVNGRFPRNTEYKYFTVFEGNTEWEGSQEGYSRSNRWAICQTMIDEIWGWENNAQVAERIQGTYFIPNTAEGQERGWETLAEAFSEINTRGIGGDVELLITEDMTIAQRLALANDTQHSITITSDGGTQRTLTFTNNGGAAGGGVAGVFVIGATGFTSADFEPARNITIDNLALIGTTALAGTIPLLMLINEVDNVVIKNCSIAATATVTGANLIRLDAHTAADRMPRNVRFENNIIRDNANVATSYVISIGTQGGGLAAPADLPVANFASNIVITGNEFQNLGQRGVYIARTNGVEISGNSFAVRSSTMASALSSAITILNGTRGEVSIAKNRFLNMSTPVINAAGWADGLGVINIMDSNLEADIYIENNYFSGFVRTGTAGSAAVNAIVSRTVAAGFNTYIRHNTFYLNQLNNMPTYSETGVAVQAYSAVHIVTGAPVIQNNLFVLNSGNNFHHAIRGDVPATASGNVFYLLGTGARIASGDDGGLTSVSVRPEGAAWEAGLRLNLVWADGSKDYLRMSRVGIYTDIYGEPRDVETFVGAFEAASLLGDINTSVERPTTLGSVIASVLGRELTLTSDVSIQTLRIFDVQGRLILSEQGISTAYTTIMQNSGVFIIETVTDAGIREVQRVIVM